MNLPSGDGGCSTQAHGIRRQDIQAAMVKAAELRALHAALLQGGSGGSPTVAMLAAGGSQSVPHAATQLSVQEDYPVFTPVSSAAARFHLKSSFRAPLPFLLSCPSHFKDQDGFLIGVFRWNFCLGSCCSVNCSVSCSQ